MLTEMMNKPEREEGGDNPGPATPAPAPSDPGFHPTVAEIMTVAGGLGAGYGASQVITGVGGAAGLTAATWVPVAAAGGTGIGAAGLAGYGVGQILNGMDWFKGIINKITDQMVIDVGTRGIMYPSVAGHSSKPGTFCVHCSPPTIHC
ncbi:MAG: hypothetical protein H7176_06315 [Bdellovibrionales bacterium]|nr:hypothetical protein [Massilia sp.]